MVQHYVLTTNLFWMIIFKVGDLENGIFKKRRQINLISGNGN